jgi:uncharacterized protein YndB with AHSA1/START domain
MTPDKIEQTLELPYPQERVWRAISTPEGLSSWFGNIVTLEAAVGSDITFVWHEHGTTTGLVEVFEPINCFAYRWRANGVSEDEAMIESNSTLVKFELTETAEGTRLELTETGFAALREDVRAISYQDNTGGWKSELGHLVAFLAGEVVSGH